MRREFLIAPAGSSAKNTMIGVGAITTVAAVIAILSVPGFVRIGVTLAMMVAMGALYRLIYNMDKITFVMDDYTLEIRGDIFGRKIDRRSLVCGGARMFSAQLDRDLEPMLKLGGTGLPGYLTGWFLLRNKSKALIYFTDKSKTVYIPTTLGYSLLLSTDDPEGLLGAVGLAK